jgi:hypothetical protein
MKTFSLAAVAAAAAAVLIALPAHAAIGHGEGVAGYPHELNQTTSSVQRDAVRSAARSAVTQGVAGAGEASPVQQAEASTLSRVQVRAEAAEAVRLGLVASGEQTVVYTAPQLMALKAAGERAVSTVVAGSR